MFSTIGYERNLELYPGPIELMKRNINPITKLLLGLYSLSWEGFLLTLRLLAPFSEKIRFQLDSRGIPSSDLMRFADSKNGTVIFFCSSAGELEQCLPLVGQLEKQLTPMILFFSASGYRYAKSIDLHHRFFLIRSDCSWDWRSILRATQPKMVIVSRHGFWPGLIFTARLYSTLIAINVSQRPGSGKLSGITKQFFLKYFDEIYLSGGRFSIRFQGDLKPKLQISGDTKYDRAIQRKTELSSPTVPDLPEEHPWLVLGSAYPDEIRLTIEAYQSIKPQLEQAWKVAVLPHDLSAENMNSIKNELKGSGLPHLLEGRLGLLFSYYSQAQASIIGGGFHEKGVHNVLEAAVFDIPVFSGPSIDAEPEAFELEEKGILKIFSSAQELADLWLMLDSGRIHASGLEFIRSRSGATQIILNHLEPIKDEGDFAR